jgi:hypothetical protein
MKIVLSFDPFMFDSCICSGEERVFGGMKKMLFPSTLRDNSVIGITYERIVPNMSV